jgi:formate dehydrogenase subunit gamma
MTPLKVADRDEILRFRKSERELHWAIVIPFMVCYATGMVLLTIYNPNPARPLRDVISWVHRASGVCLIVLPPWVLARHWHDVSVHIDNIRRAWWWRLDDVKWLFLMGPAAVSSRISLPDQGKFNAAEKINFMVLMSTYPFYIITGVMIWLPGVAFLSWLVHISMAVAATPLLLGHLFMATVNPDTRVGLGGMISGFVDRHWARHHYRCWYDECFGAGPDVAQLASHVERPEPHPAPIVGPSRESERPAASWARLRVSGFETALRACAAGGASVEGVSEIAALHGMDTVPIRLEPDVGDSPHLEHGDEEDHTGGRRPSDMRALENDLASAEPGT